MNPDHKPEARPVRPSLLGFQVILEHADIAVLPAERHSSWAACLSQQ